MSPARLLATWFGCGYSKVAPGTVGTLGALPFVSGVLIAVGLASGLAFRQNFVLFGVAVLAFRLFDIWKPGPIDSIQSLPKGWGIMADDVLAGVAAGMVANAVGAFL